MLTVSNSASLNRCDEQCRSLLKNYAFDRHGRVHMALLALKLCTCTEGASLAQTPLGRLMLSIARSKLENVTSEDIATMVCLVGPRDVIEMFRLAELD